MKDEKTPEKLDEKKQIYSIYLYPSVSDMIDGHLETADAGSRSKFVESAVKHYCGVLDAENDREFLGEEIVKTMRAIMEEFSGRVYAHLRGIDIEITMINELLATGLNELPPEDIAALRKSAAQTVARNLKSKSFETAYHTERRNRGLES